MSSPSIYLVNVFITHSCLVQFKSVTLVRRLNTTFMLTRIDSYIRLQRGFMDAFDLSRGRHDLPFLTAVHKLLDLIMLRRSKHMVESLVPPLEEMVVFLR